MSEVRAPFPKEAEAVVKRARQPKGKAKAAQPVENQHEDMTVMSSDPKERVTGDTFQKAEAKSAQSEPETKTATNVTVSEPAPIAPEANQPSAEQPTPAAPESPKPPKLGATWDLDTVLARDPFWRAHLRRKRLAYIFD
jgi:type II secretory pathway component HofQ